MAIHLLVGQTLGQFELREYLGEGGMGAVYLGYQTSLKREVAVKVLSLELSQDTEFIARFNREAQTIAALEHPHIVPIHDYGTQQGISYVVMRLLKGGTLEERLEDRYQNQSKMPSLGETSRLLQQIASALDYAHAQGIIHRDIKPSNIMFDTHGIPFLVDFGIAKLLRETTSLTQSGAGQLGTPIYMAPEQWLNEQISPKTDQYALAVVIYMMVTGQRPFDAETVYGLLQQHLNQTPPRPHEIRQGVPTGVTEVLERALAKKPADRFPTMTEFAEAFADASGDTGDSPTDFFTYTLPKRAKKSAVTANILTSFAPPPKPWYKNPWGWAVLALVGVLIAVVVLFVLPGEAEPEATVDPNELASTRIAQVFAATAEEATRLAVLWTETPTATATPTATYTPTATDTATPTATATVTASATATSTPTATATATFTPVPTDTPPPQPIAPTVLYENGYRLRLFYDNSVFYAFNPGETRIPLAHLVFAGLDSQGQPLQKDFEGENWIEVSNYEYIDPGRCVRINAAATVTLRPGECSRLNAQVNRSFNDRSVFWAAVGGTVQFGILWKGQEIGRCEVSATDCTIFLPPPEQW